MLNRRQRQMCIRDSSSTGQSFFFSKWGTIPLSSGLGLPAPSVSFRPSSASWDKYFCGGKRGTKEEERGSVVTLAGQERKGVEGVYLGVLSYRLTSSG